MHQDSGCETVTPTVSITSTLELVLIFIRNVSAMPPHSVKLSDSGGSRNIFHQQHQMQIIHGALFKSEVLVEGFRLRIDGMDKDGSRADRL